MGDGRQYISWIGIEDTIGAIHHLLQNNNMECPVNITSPNPIANYQFTKTLGKLLSKPALLTIPPSVIKAFFQEKGKEILLEGCQAMPSKLINGGYKFIHPELKDALKETLGL
ncbi:MAG: DUF1731 domain-containing protein [Deltaproteobacteria bacterium]|nr:DUF1731 domain-containing protein [Deltaproteobacteria bacterium]